MVVVTHASASTIDRCLRALPLERLHAVVVVDNASPDDSAARARAVPGVLVVEQDNLGFGAGCNAGVAHSGTAELLLFLNPDALVTETDLLLLVAHLDRHPTCAVAAPRLYDATRALTSAGRHASVATELRPLVPTLLARLLPDRRHPADLSRTGPVGYVEGACFLVRSADLAAVGGFDERFFLFFEELELARRLRGRGRTVDLVAEASAQHLSAVSRRVLPDGGREHLLRSTVRHLHHVSPWRATCYVRLAFLSLRVRGLAGSERGRARRWAEVLREAHRTVRREGTR